MCLIFTKELGLIFALAQGAREHMSKLRGNLQPFSFGFFSFVRGKNGWRVTHADVDQWIKNTSGEEWKMWARIFSFLKKLLPPEEKNHPIYSLVEDGYAFTRTYALSKEENRFFEGLLILRIIRHLGYLPLLPALHVVSENGDWSRELLSLFKTREKMAIFHINEAIAHSGL